MNAVPPYHRITTGNLLAGGFCYLCLRIEVWATDTNLNHTRKIVSTREKEMQKKFMILVSIKKLSFLLSPLK
jgi:hypothetical protein